MGRRAEQGIAYYPVKCNHIYDGKIRLLINDEGAAGYMVYNFLLAEGHEKNGYYFSILDRDEVEYFAKEVCKMELQQVERIITTCVRRKLFDKELADRERVLTSETMQDDYVRATKERRRKDTVVEVKEEIWLLDPDEKINNLVIVPRNNPQGVGIVPRNIPGKKRLFRGT